MQLLRDNLTLWTSSDNAEPEAAAASEAKKEEVESDKPEEEAKTEAEAPEAAS